VYADVPGEINAQYPTLMTPNPTMILIYWSVFYGLAIGFCLLLMFARSEATKVG
jgi:hypothetical protein